LETSKFVISLDFELHWGVFDSYGLSYNENILGAREAIPKILHMFDKYGIKSTWATVGLLFNESLLDYQKYKPVLTPSYDDCSLNPFDIEIGENEKVDKLHFAHSLIQLILDTPGQELGSHSYSHYYCQSKGQSAEEFKADLQSAISIAKDKFDIELSSFVFPKNQVNKEYLEILKQNSFTIYRDQAPNKFKWIFAERLYRLVDSYIQLSILRKNSVQKVNGIRAIRADRFLRPFTFSFLNELMLKRIFKEMTYAARNGYVYHLWWHPHNFGTNLKENLENLDRILTVYTNLNDKYGMHCVCMKDL